MQAIAAMMRAQEADPTNLEVLLALGVSHTNGQWLAASDTSINDTYLGLYYKRIFKDFLVLFKRKCRNF